VSKALVVVLVVAAAGLCLLPGALAALVVALWLLWQQALETAAR
jgi:hypothetical protein